MTGVSVVAVHVIEVRDYDVIVVARRPDVRSTCVGLDRIDRVGETLKRRVNGFASVIASSVAVMISMKWGFTGTLLAGSLCYLLAVVFTWRQPRNAGA